MMRLASLCFLSLVKALPVNYVFALFVKGGVYVNL